ncbi:hypothetical protein V8E51_008422 [Hyaloscypha variabilis]
MVGYPRQFWILHVCIVGSPWSQQNCKDFIVPNYTRTFTQKDIIHQNQIFKNAHLLSQLSLANKSCTVHFKNRYNAGLFRYSALNPLNSALMFGPRSRISEEFLCSHHLFSPPSLSWHPADTQTIFPSLLSFLEYARISSTALSSSTFVSLSVLLSFHFGLTLSDFIRLHIRAINLLSISLFLDPFICSLFCSTNSFPFI